LFNPKDRKDTSSFFTRLVRFIAHCDLQLCETAAVAINTHELSWAAYNSSDRLSVALSPFRVVRFFKSCRIVDWSPFGYLWRKMTWCTRWRRSRDIGLSEFMQWVGQARLPPTL